MPDNCSSSSSKVTNHILEVIRQHKAVMDRIEECVPSIERTASAMINSLVKGGKVIWMGNGGSSSDSQHLAAELVGRFKRDRDPISSIALSSNMSIITAVANDMGYDAIFSRQIGALCRKGDVVVGMSTSGNSANVLEALRTASSMGACCIGFTGKDGGILKELVDECIRIPSDDTARIQEAHILAGHIICDIVEKEMSKINEDRI